MNITADQLQIALPKAPMPWLVALGKMPAKWEINTPARFAAFVGQLAHECNQFLRLVENLNYSTERLMVVWPKRFPTVAAAIPYAHNPEGLANKVYAGRLGNGPEASGDGYRYRGRGPIQLTGRANYAAASAAIGVDLIANPGHLLLPSVGLDAAAWFWTSNKLNELADTGDHLAITKEINGGVHGYFDPDPPVDSRLEWVQAVLRVVS